MMVKITFEFPDESLNQLVSDFCERYGYQDEIEDADGNPIPNPQSRVNFVASKIISDAKAVSYEHQRQKAYRAINEQLSERLSAVSVTVTVE